MASTTPFDNDEWRRFSALYQFSEGAGVDLGDEWEDIRGTAFDRHLAAVVDPYLRYLFLARAWRIGNVWDYCLEAAVGALALAPECPAARELAVTSAFQMVLPPPFEYSAQSPWDETRAQMDALLRVLPDEATALAVRAILRLGVGERDAGLRDLHRAEAGVSCGPQWALNACLSVAQRMLGNAQQEAQLLRVAWDARAPDMPQCVFDRLLTAYLSDAEPAVLLTDLTVAVELWPEEPRYWTLRGRVFAALGRLDEADADFDVAFCLSANPEGPLYRLRLIVDHGRFWLDAGQAERATASLLSINRMAQAQDDRFLQNEPIATVIAEVRYLAGAAYVQSGEIERAASQWLQAVSVAPDSRWAHLVRADWACLGVSYGPDAVRELPSAGVTSSPVGDPFGDVADGIDDAPGDEEDAEPGAENLRTLVEEMLGHCENLADLSRRKFVFPTARSTRKAVDLTRCAQDERAFDDWIVALYQVVVEPSEADKRRFFRDILGKRPDVIDFVYEMRNRRQHDPGQRDERDAHKLLKREANWFWENVGGFPAEGVMWCQAQCELLRQTNCALADVTAKLWGADGPI